MNLLHPLAFFFLLIFSQCLHAGLAHELMAPVVKVWMKNSTGSGVIIESGGARTLIVTNAHVVDDQETARVERYLWNEKKTRIVGSVQVTGAVISANSTADVAVIAIDGWLEWPTTSFADVEDLEILTPVIAVGAPMWEAVQIFRGVIIDQDRKGLVQYDAPILPGCSGGPVYAKINNKWIVIGLVNAGFKGTHISFAIPARRILEVLKKGAACQ